MTKLYAHETLPKEIDGVPTDGMCLAVHPDYGFAVLCCLVKGHKNKHFAQAKIIQARSDTGGKWAWLDQCVRWENKS